MVGQQGNTVRDNTDEMEGKRSNTMMPTMFDCLSLAQCDWCYYIVWIWAFVITWATPMADRNYPTINKLATTVTEHTLHLHNHETKLFIVHAYGVWWVVPHSSDNKAISAQLSWSWGFGWAWQLQLIQPSGDGSTRSLPAKLPRLCFNKVNLV